ncbi:hypothetical protein N665_0008s0063 [Sinapis alba]|nr:hypothetical protein N665_0008s0063 [Sinapis alba]
MEQLLASCFGGLFKLPVRRCAFSAKLVHGLMTRQVVTKKRYEMWPVFGGNPMRFSLAEFGTVTGLPCGEFEEGYVVDDMARVKKTDFVFWDRLFYGRRDVTIADVAAMVASDKEMPPNRKLKLCLLIIVDGVLLATTQNPKPTVKHVKRLESLKKFLGFPWGREAFWWTISGMLPAQRVLGKCDDPEGGFCKKLRQESKILPGFPLALQLWAFEAIPLLVKRLSGDDGETILTFSGAKLPQHSGLPLSGVLEAEHDPQVRFGSFFCIMLKVQPMAERGADEDEGWGEFDCEINDRKVAYVIELLNNGHVFRKEEWGGGDAAEPKYEHDSSGRTGKRKGRGFQSKEAEGPALKQRRLSRYFTRVGSGGEDRLGAVEAKIENLMELVAKLKRIVVKQGRQLRRRKVAGSGRHSSRETEPKKLFSDSEGESTDNKTDGGDDVVGGDTSLGDDPSEAIMMDKGLGKMKESDVVPLEGAKKGDPREEGNQVYYGCGSNTFFVSEDEDFGELNKLVGVITRAAEAQEDKVASAGDDTSSEESENEKDDDENKVLDVSDSSPCRTTEKHKPVEKEEELAALLLAKEAFSLANLVPAAEDSDYQFFESVLIANPKVLHLNAGKYDLDNQFFLDLATPEKWVSTKVLHMEALVDYVGGRHEVALKARRCLFLPPWFAGHLQGKTRAFNAAKCNKGRVLCDGRLSGFLTKEGKKWGEDVDTLYSPMIWGGNHWVGLCISLTDWRVLVLDPNPALREMSEVWELMETVSKMLPYLVEKVCTPPKDKAYNLEAFAIERMGGAYENKRSGDCGPVSIKFMELHALGNPHPRMDGLTDALVDIMRKQFAMDLYKDWVVPLYMGGSQP